MPLSEKITLAVCIVLALMGTLFLTIAYRSWDTSYQIIKKGLETQGVVVELARRPTRGNERPSGALAPVVQFVTQNGETLKYYSTLYTSPCPYEVGQVVPIWYLPDDPQQATLKGGDAWVLSIAFGVFGVAAALIGYVGLTRFLLEWLRKG